MNQEQPETNISLMVESSAIISSMCNCNIRYAINRNNEMWFRGGDVASFLGYANGRNAVAAHVDEEDKIAFEALKDRLSGRRMETEHPHKIYINKSGLICLTLSSSKPEAKAFKRWITSEVIPAILNTGEYNANANMLEFSRPNCTHNQYLMMDEYNLHVRLVKFIRE